MQDEDTVSVKPANHRSRGAGSEASLGNPRLAFEHFAEAGLCRCRQLNGFDRCDTLERAEGRLLFAAGRHRDLLPDGRQPDLEIERRTLARPDQNGLLLVAEPVQVDYDRIRAGLQAGKLEAAGAVGEHRSTELHKKDGSTMNGCHLGCQGHRSSQGCPGLGRSWRKARQNNA